jgi:hypothetical protein
VLLGYHQEMVVSTVQWSVLSDLELEFSSALQERRKVAVQEYYVEMHRVMITSA